MYKLDLRYDPLPSDNGITPGSVLMGLCINHKDDGPIPETEARVRGALIFRLEAERVKSAEPAAILISEDEYQFLLKARKAATLNEVRCAYIAALDAVDHVQAHNPKRQAKKVDLKQVK